MAAIELDPLVGLDGSGPDLPTLRRRRPSEGSRRASGRAHGLPSHDRPSGGVAAATGLGLLTTFTLPARYDHLPVVTRLWLQSRYNPSDSAGHSGHSNPGVGSDDDDLAEPGLARKITWRNFKISLDLTRILGPRLMAILYKDRAALALPAMLYTASFLIDGLIPAASLWANAQVLDLVEQSFSGSPSTWRTACAVAGTAVGLEVFMWMSSDVFRGAVDFLRGYTKYHLERLYMGAKLNLVSGEVEDDTYEAVVHEAGAVAGFTQMWGVESPPYDPWAWVQSIGSTISSSLELGLQGVLIFRTLRTATRETNMTAGNTILISLSLAPLIFDIISENIDAWLPKSWQRSHNSYDWEGERELDVLRQFVEGEHHEELVLFNLKPYVLSRWDKISRKRTPQRMSWGYQPYTLVEILRTASGSLVTNAFYALLAVRAIPTSMTLGAIHLHRSSAEKMHSTIRALQWHLENAWQVPFFLAATFAAQDGPVRQGPQIDYDSLRRTGGMRLEARNLGLTYEGSAPTLKNINLTVEAGETLAIVGFNGGGKTTLVRALLGVHSHTGTLLINDVPFEDYAAETVHKRQSCLFQDFDKYNLDVRCNVGFGDWETMDDDAAVNAALELGGAQKIVKKIGGLERILQPTHHADHARMRRSKIWDPEEGPDDNQDSGDEAGAEDAESNGADSVQEAGDNSGDDEPAGSAHDEDYEPNYAALSGGQWQRIGLSRAFMRRDVDLVVFDEPSASLDPVAEAEAMDAIHSLSSASGRRTTTVFVSHRLGTVRRADRIAFMHEGSIVELGTHAELLAMKGKYYHFWDIQSRQFKEDAVATGGEGEGENRDMEDVSGGEQ